MLGIVVGLGIQGAAEGTNDSLWMRATTIWPGAGTGEGVVKALIVGLVNMMITLFQVITFFGLMLSRYLPLLPYIAWLGALISLMAIWIEGVVAAPLWAFAHLDTDGEGMGQKASHGYTFILQPLFRPVLMVIGFLMSVIVMEVIGRFFFATFGMTVADAGSIGSFVDLAGYAVVIGVFFTTSVMIVNTSVNLIHLVPDVVLHWVGSSTGAAQMGKNVGDGFNQGAAGVAGFGTQAANAAKGSVGKAKAAGAEK